MANRMATRSITKLGLALSLFVLSTHPGSSEDAGVRSLRKFHYVYAFCPGEKKLDGSRREGLSVNLVNGYGIEETIALVIKDKVRRSVYRTVEAYGYKFQITNSIRFSGKMTRAEKAQASLMLSILLPVAKACADRSNRFWKDIKENYARVATPERRAAGNKLLLKDRAAGRLR